MKKHPIIVLISGSGTNLQAIIDKCKNVNIQCVISDNYMAYGLTRAEKAGINSIIFEPYLNQSRESYCDDLASFVARHNPQLVVLAGFMKILTPNFFKYFHDKQVVNIHPSLLPKHKGLHTHKRVLKAGDKEHGVTIHYANEELDAGPIIWQSSFFIQPDDTPDTLAEKVHNLEHQWYPWVIDKLVIGEIGWK